MAKAKAKSTSLCFVHSDSISSQANHWVLVTCCLVFLLFVSLLSTRFLLEVSVVTWFEVVFIQLSTK